MDLIKRKGYFHLEYYDHYTGKIRRGSTHTKIKRDAILFLKEFNRNLIHVVQDKNQITLVEFHKRYLIYGKINFSIKYLLSIDLSFRRFINYFNNIELSKIKKAEIEKFLLEIYRSSPYSARQYLRILKAAFNKARSWDYLKENPFVGVKLPKPRKNLPIFITLEQFDLLTAFETDEQLNRLYILAFNTGLRLGELCFLQWNSISFDERLLYVRNCYSFVTKSKAERVVPLNTTHL